MDGAKRNSRDLKREVQDAVPYLLPYLGFKDASLRGLAAWTLGLLGAETARPQLEALLGDESEVSLYINARLVRRRVSDLAKEALATITRTKRPLTFSRNKLHKEEGYG
jgi:HEAT repeat protein